MQSANSETNEKPTGDVHLVLDSILREFRRYEGRHWRAVFGMEDDGRVGQMFCVGEPIDASCINEALVSSTSMLESNHELIVLCERAGNALDLAPNFGVKADRFKEYIGAHEPGLWRWVAYLVTGSRSHYVHMDDPPGARRWIDNFAEVCCVAVQQLLAMPLSSEGDYTDERGRGKRLDVRPGVEKHDEFDELMKWVTVNLKGKQRRVMELVINADGECPLSDVAIDERISWQSPFDNAFNGICKAVNPKLKNARKGWQLKCHDNNAQLAKIGQK